MLIYDLGCSIPLKITDLSEKDRFTNSILNQGLNV